MKIERFACGPLDANCYIIFQEGSATCAVIDPADADAVLSRLQSHGLSCTHILLTHGHFDHILGVSKLRAVTGAQVCIHEADAFMLQNENASLAAMVNAHIGPCHADLLLKDGDLIEAGGLSFRVIHTPGHSPGGVCYWVEDVLFSGDTLFYRSVGRADFPGADPQLLIESVMNKLFSLPGDAVVYPGHMRKTTLEYERENNPYCRRERGHQW